MQENLKYFIEPVYDLETMLTHFWLIQQLNPNMTYERYSSLLPELIKHGNYYQAVCYIEPSGLAKANNSKQPVGLTGVWIHTQLWCGKFMEIDNFVVDEKYRGSGVGGMLVDWVVDQAHKNQCQMVRLDTYVTLDKAHRFYFSKGFKILGFAMVKNLLVQNQN